GAIGRARVPEKLGGLSIGLALLDFADLLFQMAVGREQIEPSVKIVIEEENTEFQQEPAGRADAFGNGLIGKEEGPLRDIQRAHFVGEIANGDAERLI